ncbi:FUSC family protein [Faunimonas sp. B44]|uniref:FUSC family protein n=1 Tax=Faunimonas sp. B44 TaxID=3461493 RepID=UPI004044650E
MSLAAVTAPFRGFVQGSARDVLRVAVQSVGATALAFGAMTAMDLPHLSWAIISALFTIQLSSDSTLRVAMGRIAGTVIGTLVGLASVYLIGGADDVLLRLVAVTALTNAIAAARPDLNYGAVAAAIIALEPSPDLPVAIERAVAILIGAGSGLLVALVVLPEIGRDRAQRLICRALSDCRELLSTTIGVLTSEAENDRNPSHARFLAHLERARATESRLHRHLRSGCGISHALTAVERLWHGLVLLDRVVTHQLPRMHPADREAVRAPLAAMQESSCRYLEKMIAHLEGRAPAPDRRDLARRLRPIEKAGGVHRNGLGREPDEVRAMQALVFAAEEVLGNLAELECLAAKPATPGRTGDALAPARTAA